MRFSYELKPAMGVEEDNLVCNVTTQNQKCYSN